MPKIINFNQVLSYTPEAAAIAAAAKAPTARAPAATSRRLSSFVTFMRASCGDYDT